MLELIQIEKLNQGEWVHIFPEGKVMFDRSWTKLRWGVGRMIHECHRAPLVIPIYHVGMDHVLPSKAKPFIPRVGKMVSVVIGDPIDLLDAKMKCHEENMNPVEARIFLTSIIQERFDSLKSEVLLNYADEVDQST